MAETLKRVCADRSVDVERAGENLDRAIAAEVDGSGRERAVASGDELADAVDETAELVGRGVGDDDGQAGRIAGVRRPLEVDQARAGQTLEFGRHIVGD